MTGSFYGPALQKLLCLSRACCQSVGAGNGEFFILLRAGGATDTDRSNDLPVDDDRNPTLERREVVKSGIPIIVDGQIIDRKSTRLNSSHDQISYAVFCLKKKKRTQY